MRKFWGHAMRFCQNCILSVCHSSNDVAFSHKGFEEKYKLSCKFCVWNDEISEVNIAAEDKARGTQNAYFHNTNTTTLSPLCELNSRALRP